MNLNKKEILYSFVSIVNKMVRRVFVSYMFVITILYCLVVCGISAELSVDIISKMSEGLCMFVVYMATIYILFRIFEGVILNKYSLFFWSFFECYFTFLFFEVSINKNILEEIIISSDTFVFKILCIPLVTFLILLLILIGVQEHLKRKGCGKTEQNMACGLIVGKGSIKISERKDKNKR